MPAFSESLTAVRTPAELIAEPFDRFLVLASPPATPSVPDTSLTFAAEPIGAAPATPVAVALAFPLNVDGTPALVGADADSVRRIDGAPGTWPLPVRTVPRIRRRARLDRAARLESRLPHRHRAVRSGRRVPAAAERGRHVCRRHRSCVRRHVSDLRLRRRLAGRRRDGRRSRSRRRRPGRRARRAPEQRRRHVAGAAAVRRHVQRARASPGPISIAMPIPMRCSSMRPAALHVYINRQAGAFARVADLRGAERTSSPSTVADIDADGAIDVVTLDAMGVVRLTSRPGETWTTPRDRALGRPRRRVARQPSAASLPISTTTARSIWSRPAAASRASGWPTATSACSRWPRRRRRCLRGRRSQRRRPARSRRRGRRPTDAMARQAAQPAITGR